MNPDALEKASIFCATRADQIRFILSLIDQYETQNNVLIVVTAASDLSLLDSIRKAIPPEFFDRVVFSELPEFPASRRSTFVRHRKVYNVFRKTMKSATEDFSEVDLYLCYANNYYIFCKNVLDELQVKYTLNLIEEGFETYKWTMPEINWGAFSWSEELDGAVDSQIIKMRWSSFLASFLDLLKKILLFWLPAVIALGKLLYELALLVLLLISTLTKKNLLSSFCSLNNLMMPRKYRYTLVPHFDNGFFCFPEKMKRIHEFEIDHIYSLEFTVRKGSHLKQSGMNFKTVPDGIPIFISQKYGDYEMYYCVVFSILRDMGIREVYFKFHPQEERQEIRALFDDESAKYPDIIVYNDPEYDDVAVEDLLQKKNFSQLIGLTISSLMYCNIMDIKTTPISIVEVFEKRYQEIATSESRLNSKNELKDLERDYLVFKEVAGVQQLVL